MIKSLLRKLIQSENIYEIASCISVLVFKYLFMLDFAFTLAKMDKVRWMK